MSAAYRWAQEQAMTLKDRSRYSFNETQNLRCDASFDARRYANRLLATYLVAVFAFVWTCHLILPLLRLDHVDLVPILLAKMAIIVAASAFYMKFRILRWVAQYERVNDELRHSRVDLVERLACAAEYRDDAVGLHNQRIGRYAQIVAQQLGLPGETCDLIRHAATLHDLGKIAVSDAILLKPGRLTDEERTEMSRHVSAGAAMLSESDDPLLAMAHRIALEHHENWDGSGYPRGTAGPDISLEGRIVAVCDVFDALISPRPYKEAWDVPAAFEEIRLLAGTKFDPEVVGAFLQCREAILAAYGQAAPQSEGLPRRKASQDRSRVGLPASLA